MEIGERELEKIGKYVQAHLAEWSGSNIVDFRANRELELLERIVRVEEGMKSTQELMRQGFEQIDKRFGLIENQMDKRFELTERHMDKRFSQQQWAIGLGVTIIVALIGVLKIF